MQPRIVLIRRETEYESLLKEHGTPQMARFQLERRGVKADVIHRRHIKVINAAEQALGRVPTTWRKTWTLRRDLDRFRFDPEDVIVAVGWDGLVPNVAKYLTGQPVIGVNPFEFEQRMMRFAPDAIVGLYEQGIDAWVLEHRTMAEVRLDDGRSIRALNELFCGHQSHQSAKYDIHYGGAQEYQSSSGIIVTTGTGATGWARSVSETMGLTADDWELAPVDPQLHFFVREAWKSAFSGTDIIHGAVSEREFAVTSKMQEGGIIFGDGIESDHLLFQWGQRATFSAAAETLNLVIQTAPSRGVTQTRRASAGVAAAQEQTTFDAVLASFGQKKIPIIKAVRDITGLGLRETKALVGRAPCAVKKGVSKAEAVAIKGAIEAAGGIVEITEHQGPRS